MTKNISRLIKLGFFIIIFSSYLIFKDKISAFLFPRKIIQPFQGLTINSINQLSITFENKTISINKKNNQWIIGEFKADNERINKLIENTSKIVKDEIVSTNKKRHVDLGIQNNKIIFKTKDKNYVLYIGNSQNTDKNYVKVNDENEVFMASGLSDVFTPFDYRDLKVNLINDENKITSISINDLLLEKKKDKWFIGSKEIKKDRVDFFLSDLKTLKATDISTKEATLSYPELTIKIKVSKTENTENFYPIDDGKENFYLKTSNSNFLYTIPAVYVSSLKKEEKDFIE